MEWYRWFPGLYADDTLHLSLEQDAIYRRLLDWYMTGRVPLPCPAIALARICQISLDKWQEHESTILAFFRRKGDRFHHKRCDIELDRQDSTSKRLSEAALKAHEHRKNNKAISDTSMPCHSQGSAMPPIEEIKRRGDIDSEVSKEPPYPPLFENFWALYPKKRRDPKSKCLVAYLKALTKTTEENLNAAIVSYSASDEVARGFAKGTIAWLNAERWTVDYSPPNQTSPVDRKTTYADSLRDAGEAALHHIRETEKVRA